MSSAPPTIKSVIPFEGSCRGQEEVFIEVENYKPILLVIFGDQEAQIIAIDEANRCDTSFHSSFSHYIIFINSTIKVRTPSYQPKSVPVFLIDPFGSLHSSPVPISYNYLPGTICADSYC